MVQSRPPQREKASPMNMLIQSGLCFLINLTSKQSYVSGQTKNTVYIVIKTGKEKVPVRGRAAKDGGLDVVKRVERARVPVPGWLGR